MTESVKYHDICDDCMHKGYCDMAQFGGHNPHITACSHFIAAKQTNADRIRAMTDEELATFFGTLPCCPPGNADELCFPDNTCGADTKMMVKCWGTWLKAPAEEVQDET